jgi:hypothetical protein
MPFLILGYDGEDDQALDRRLAVRDDHIKMGDKLRDEGKVLYGVAMLDDSEKMIGSVYVMNFDTREEVDEWLQTEPYVTGDVWKKIEITPCRVGPSFVNMKVVE